jgi:glycosyltransferase involved in cell wall biosynthesis
MDAYHIPSVGEHNPYQTLLARGLQAAGIRVEMKKQVNAKLANRIVRRAATRPQVVHVHWPSMLSRPTLAGSIIASTSSLTRLARVRRSGVRIIWTVHQLVGHENAHPAWERLALMALVRVAHQPIVHSRGAAGEAAQVLRYPEARFSIIPHGHYADWYANDISREEARARFDIAPDKTVFLFFGRIREFKGVPELLDAFAQLSRPDVALLIAGDPWTDDLQRLINERAAADRRIRATFGFIPDDDVQLYMNASDAIVLPFRAGVTSGSLALAMSFGKAAVAANAPSLAGVPPQDGAIFFDQARPGALVEALERAAGTDLHAMGERNREHIMRWDWDRVGRLTRRVYEGERVRD